MSRDESPFEATPDADVDAARADRASRPRVRQRMRSNTQTLERRRRIAGTIALVVSAAFMINALVGDKGLLGSLKAKQQHDAINSTINDLRRDSAARQEEIRRLKTDPSALEEAARRQLGLIRPGETLVIIKDAKPAEPRAADHQQ